MAHPVDPATRGDRVTVWRDGALHERDDRLAVEAPLEIRVRARDGERAVSITMRTPGDDAELAVGFLFTEGLVHAADQVIGVSSPAEDTVLVEMNGTLPVVAERQFAVTSACGVCGKSSLDGLRAMPAGPLATNVPVVRATVLARFPEALREQQAEFAATGGSHAAALFDAGGQLHLVREDVGRHNAVDKVIGALLNEDALPARDGILLVSGRASFELVQKALMARIPVLAAVGAPSTLAVELAREAGLTLVGFLRPDRFNVYCGLQRISA